MRIIIAGTGSVGTYLVKMLTAENHDVVVVETNEEQLSILAASYDILPIAGSATSFSILNQAGAKNATLFVAVTEDNEINLTACILAKRLGVQKTIARIDSSEYLQPQNQAHWIGLGVDALVYPQMLAAREIVNLLAQTGTSEVFNFSQGMLFLYVLKLTKEAPVINQTLLCIFEENTSLSYRILAITRNDKTFIAKGNDVFQIGDVIYVIATQVGISKITQYSGQKSISPKNIMIVGGSRMGARIAKVLEHTSNIKLIEIDEMVALKLSDFLPETLILNGDGRDIETLRQEGIEQMDAFIAVTGSSETNILTCLQAKKMGVKKTIAAVENIDYINLAENLGVDAIVNKKMIAASYILRFTINADVKSFMLLTANDSEVFEFIVRPGAKITKGKLKEIDFPLEAVVCGFTRNKAAYIATEETHIHANDHVVVFSLPSAVNRLENFFN